LWDFESAARGGDIVGDTANVGLAGSAEGEDERPGDFSGFPAMNPEELIVVDWVGEKVTWVGDVVLVGGTPEVRWADEESTGVSSDEDGSDEDEVDVV